MTEPPTDTVPAILPPATIGILGGGQLGRMLGSAARALGYGVRILDPDIDCPASVVADRVEVGAYDDVSAAVRLASGCAVITYELEHVDAALVDTIIASGVPVRPGARALRVTQDRVAERRFVQDAGAAVAPWRMVTTGDDDALDDAIEELGAPVRLKAAFGGYDGRSQVRIGTEKDRRLAWMDLGRPPGRPAIVERELRFADELSVIVARSMSGAVVPWRCARNVHDQGILVESEWPAELPEAVHAEAAAIGTRLAAGLDLVGLLTVELFLMPDGDLVVNELAPRVHNSGHATIEAAATSQFEQHIRMICGLAHGDPAPLASAAMVNLLGTGVRRPARLAGIDAALAEPACHLHLYGKRDVVERRKMGHLTALGPTTGEALTGARQALERLWWEP